MAMNSIDNSAIAHFVTDFVPTLQVTLQNLFTERTGYVFYHNGTSLSVWLDVKVHTTQVLPNTCFPARAISLL